MAHNDVLAAEARQEALGWQVRAAAVAGRLEIRLLDRDGKPLAAERIDARLVRPTDARLDRTLALRPAADGVWNADIADAPAGQWEVVMTIHRGGDRMDRVERVVTK